MSVGGFAEVNLNLDRLEAELHGRAVSAMEEVGHYLANYAKTHHPWTPRTGLTDVSTVGGIESETREYVRAVLSAGTSYSVFLEWAREGRWAWLMPAVEASQGAIKSILERHLAL